MSSWSAHQLVKTGVSTASREWNLNIYSNQRSGPQHLPCSEHKTAGKHSDKITLYER